MYVDGHVNIFYMVDIDLFTIVALSMMVVQLGYTETTSQVIEDVIRQLPFEETKLDGEADQNVSKLKLCLREIDWVREPIVEEVKTQESIIKEVRTQEPIVEESSKDAGTDDDDDADFLVDKENEIVKPDVDVHLIGKNPGRPKSQGK
ncbi:hypothetical protein Tco_0627425 [Tanacetum coccineum]|uniref:Uncharacterized protein n=1 Tax=Tanacetum coccineum TaxID=301880 RepID=A0ABQ4WMK2_9ASTR